MRLQDLVATSAAVAGVSSRLEKIARLSAFLERVAPDEIPVAVGFLSGAPRQARLGVGYAALVAASDVAPSASRLRSAGSASAFIFSSGGSAIVLFQPGSASNTNPDLKLR